MDDFKHTLDRFMAVSGKSLNQIADDGGIDRAYLFRLYHGEKSNPSPEVILKIWIGVIFDRTMIEKEPDLMQHGLSILAGSLVKTMGPRKLLERVTAV